MKQIPLRNSDKYALVDAEDFERLNHWKWYLSPDGYAVAGRWMDGKVKTIRMHRLINQTPIGLETDHINGNRLDNRKTNLRTVTRQQNTMNRGPKPNTKSGVKGVSWDRDTQKWRADITIDGQKCYLGKYKDLQKAAAAYNRAAKKHFGQYARVN